MNGAKTSVLREAFWLAGVDVRQRWASYPASALLYCLIGLLVGGLLVAEAEPSNWFFEAAMPDFLMLAVVPGLMVNQLLNPDLKVSLRRDDPYTRQLYFRRSLPVTPGTIVMARMLTMLANLPLAGTTFFLVVGAFGAFAGGGAVPTGVTFLAFALVWTGYALFSGGLLVFVWTGVGKTAELMLAVAMPLFYLLLSAAVSLLSGRGPVGWTISLVERYGLAAGVAVLLAGFAAFVLWGWVTARSLRKRDLSV